MNPTTYFRNIFVVVFLFGILPVYGGGSTLVDSLLVEVKQVERGGDTERLVDVYMRLGEAYYQNRDEKAIPYFEKALEIVEKHDMNEHKGELLNDLGFALYKKGNYQEAAKTYLKVLDIDQKYVSKKLLAKTVTRISDSYQNLGDFVMAFDYQLKALELNEALKDTMGIARAHYGFGTIFFYQESYTQAIDYYRNAKTFYQVMNDQQGLYNCLGAIGSTYERLGKNALSLKYNLESLEAARGMNYEFGIAYSTHNIGSNYFISGKYEEALKHLNEALVYKKKLKDVWGQIGTYRALADCYIQYGKPQKALPLLEEGLSIAEELDSKTRIIEMYKYFALAHKAMGNYKTSLDYMMKYTEIKDDIFSETALREMGERRSKYEIQKREEEINELKVAKELLEKEQQIEGLYNSILIGAAIFLLVLLRLMYSRYSFHRESNRLLEEKNAQIKRQNDQLEDANKKQLMTNLLLEEKNQLMEKQNDQINLQNEKLESSNEDLKQFAYVASHDLKEPLRMINAYTSLLKKRYASSFDENAHEFMGYIVDAVNRMDTLLTDLLTYSRVNTREEAHNWMDSRELVEICIANLRHPIESKGAQVHVAEDLPKVKVNKSQMLQLFQNLISNAVKFTKDEKPEVFIRCKRKDDHFIFEVKDNGIGMAPENKEKVFEVFRRLHSRAEYEGSGIGLATCKKIVEKHRGKIWVESELDEGSSFFFSIPAAKEDSSEEQVNAQRKATVAA
ncbi:MAG: tetratricopeptide repeat protein [Bacteroidota bacterium]